MSFMEDLHFYDSPTPPTTPAHQRGSTSYNNPTWTGSPLAKNVGRHVQENSHNKSFPRVRNYIPNDITRRPVRLESIVMSTYLEENTSTEIKQMKVYSHNSPLAT